MCAHTPFLTRYKAFIMCVLDRTTKFLVFDLLLHSIFIFLSARLLLLHSFQQFKEHLEQLSLI